MNLTHSTSPASSTFAAVRTLDLGPAGIRLSWLALGVAVAMSLMSRMPLDGSATVAQPNLTLKTHAKAVAVLAVPALVPQPAIPGAMSFDGELASR